MTSDIRQDLFKVGAYETVQHKLLRAFNRHDAY